MKLRIKGNSIRFRLSISEVKILSGGTQIEEATNFGITELVYIVKPADAETMNVTFVNNRITLSIPLTYLAGWPSNSVVGFEETITVGTNQSLRLLLEKDFKCLDVSEEDQADFYENPAKSC